MLTSIGTSPRLCIPRLVSADPGVGLASVFGEVTAIRGGTGGIGSSLLSPSGGWPAGLTRTNACVVGVVGMTIVALPKPAPGAGTFWADDVQVAPPSTLTATSKSCDVG